MPKVSVIIPIYGVEDTIERCAIHLFEQTLDDLELIFIDDCSPDSSIQILYSVLERYPKRQHQTRVLKMPKNSGQAAVRKYGIIESKGEYIIHCDSDDWPERNMYEEMYNEAVLKKADLVIADYCFDVNAISYNWGQFFDNQDLISHLLNNRLSGALWNKLVKRSILEQDTFVFSEDNMCEDFLYTMQYLLNCETVSFIHKPLYHYIYNPKSTTHKMTEDAILLRHRQISNNVEKSINLIKSRGLYKRYRNDIIRQCLFVKNSLKEHIQKDLFFDKWKSTFSEINSKVLICPAVPFAEKMIYLMMYLRIYQTYKLLKGKLNIKL